MDRGWLRLVGSLKLQVSFAEYSLFYRALLQKRPIILKSLLIVATPYNFYAGSFGVVGSFEGTSAFSVLFLCASFKCSGLFCRVLLNG